MRVLGVRERDSLVMLAIDWSLIGLLWIALKWVATIALKGEG